MTEYILEIVTEKGHKRCFSGIISIEFYEKSIRVIDADGVIMHMDIRDAQSVKIYPGLSGDVTVTEE